MDSTIYLRVVGRTDIGNVRKNNEDSFVVADLNGTALIGPGGSGGRFEVGDRGVLLAVSDGMGGLRAGEVASALVIDTLPKALRDARASAPGEEQLRTGVQRAHERVWHTAQEEGIRMGATLTAVYVQGDVAWIAEVGDSRAYLIRSGKIAQLTKDQSLVQKLLDAGAVSPEDAAHSPYRSVILQAMGHQEDVAIALGRLQLRARDCLLLCSDGLTTHLSDEDIRSVVLGAPDLSVACDRLVNLAKARGGFDNITAVLAGLGGPLPVARSSSDELEQTFEVVQSFN
ncbi:MAG TPA: protein phosphatase 2C domain-containing protein [Polyangiaceae bacterium]|jgi:serine/threonine protein phosphatase PrpC|nr:protein phosphatase 2C domain-containing protein [Polyangiaceae bacterium]